MAGFNLITEVQSASADGREINPTVFTKEDFLENVAQKNHFLLTVMRGQKIMLKGTADELEAIARGA